MPRKEAAEKKTAELSHSSTWVLKGPLLDEGWGTVLQNLQNQNRQIHDDRTQTSSCERLGKEGDRGATANGNGVSLGRSRQRWWLHNPVNVLNATEFSTLERLKVNFMLRDFYLNFF